MTTCVAFLRAINVGGHAVVRMSDLRDAFAAAGCANARTFIASGNVVFEAPAQRAAALFGRIRERATRLLCGETVVCFRTLAEIERLVRSDRFGARATDHMVRLYVAFLTEKPGRRFPFRLCCRRKASSRSEPPAARCSSSAVDERSTVSGDLGSASWRVGREEPVDGHNVGFTHVAAAVAATPG